MIRLILILGLILAFMTACAPPADEDDPADMVLDYLQAKIDGDRETLVTLICAELEATVNREAQSFASMEARLEDASCQRDGDSDTVTCTGSIYAEYNGENTEFPLVSYRVVRENEEWKWCGEAE